MGDAPSLSTLAEDLEPASARQAARVLVWLCVMLGSKFGRTMLAPPPPATAASREPLLPLSELRVFGGQVLSTLSAH